MALQATSADLGALQILQDADGAVFLFRGTAQAFDIAGVIFVRAVGEIQAANVHAQAKQVTHRGFGMASRADGADDLGTAGGRRQRRERRKAQRMSLGLKFHWRVLACVVSMRFIPEFYFLLENFNCNCLGSKFLLKVSINKDTLAD